MCQSQNFAEAKALAKALASAKICCCHFVRVLALSCKLFLQSIQTAMLTSSLLILEVIP